jgi:hypothetical protein
MPFPDSCYICIKDVVVSVVKSGIENKMLTDVNIFLYTDNILSTTRHQCMEALYHVVRHAMTFRVLVKLTLAVFDVRFGCP